MSSTVGTTWLATVVGLGGLFGLLFTVGAAKQLYRLHKIQAPDNTIAPDPNNPLPTRHPPVKKVKIALCLILVALLLFIIRICVILANFVTMSNPPRYGICVLDTASCREGRRQDHEWSLEVGRISYAQGFFTIVGRVALFAVLLMMKRVLLLPATANPSRTMLIRVGDAVQLVVLLVLGFAAWITAITRYRRPGYVLTIFGASTGVEDVGIFIADLAFSSAIYIWAAFACWAVFMAVPVIASLLRKIRHSRSAGIPENKIHITVVFTKWIVPFLLLIVSLFATSIFLIIFRRDVGPSAGTASAALEGVSSTYGDVVVYGVSLWATKRIVRLFYGSGPPQQYPPQPVAPVAQL